MHDKITNVALTDDAMLTFSIRLSLAKLLSAGQRGRVTPMELIWNRLDDKTRKDKTTT